jgi:hypothetical protein
MGVSEGAIRKRVKRGTLDHDRADDGRIYVSLLGAGREVDEGADPSQRRTHIHEGRESVFAPVRARTNLTKGQTLEKQAWRRSTG